MVNPARLENRERITRRRPRVRMAPHERRQQLIDVTAHMLTEHGVDKIQISHVATAAGVTRPVVYKFFPNRQSLIIGVIEDFEAEMNHRLMARYHTLPADTIGRTRALMAVVCDTIEAKGAGPWHLLDARGPDPAIAEAGDAVRRRMTDPWQERIAQRTGASHHQVIAVSHMMVAASRAALNLWLDGTLTRDMAAESAARGVRALLQEYGAAAHTDIAPR